MPKLGEGLLVELFDNAVWTKVSTTDAMFTESDKLARAEVVERNGKSARLIRPLQYIRCRDLSNGKAAEIKAKLQAGEVVSCRVRVDTETIAPEMIFAMQSITIHDIYENVSGSKVLWMITGLLDPLHAVE